MTKYQLLQRISVPVSGMWKDSSGREYIGAIRKFDLEDGSGRSFNITIMDAFGVLITFHMRTID